MGADVSGIVGLLLAIVEWFKSNYIVFLGTRLSLWSIFVSGAAVAAITTALFGKGDKDDG